MQGNVRMGKDCSVQAYSIVIGYGAPDEEQGIIELGEGVRIAPQVSMLSGNHRFEDLSVPIRRQGHSFAPIKIGDDVWIAAGARIMAGVTIGKGCVVAAGAVVTKDLPNYSVAAGVPARIIKTRVPG